MAGSDWPARSIRLATSWTGTLWLIERITQ